MLTGVLVIAAAGVCALLASCLMWWATKRSAVWAMAAGALLVFAVFAGAIVIAGCIPAQPLAIDPKSKRTLTAILPPQGGGGRSGTR
jgi:hypothetical protein